MPTLFEISVGEYVKNNWLTPIKKCKIPINHSGDSLDSRQKTKDNIYRQLFEGNSI